MSYLRAQSQGDLVPDLLESLAQPHIDSFDYFLNEGLEHVMDNLEGLEVALFIPYPIYHNTY